MKRWFLIVIIMTLAVNIQGQQYKVQKFALLSNDLTASVNSRKDNNGKYCALLKISINTPDATFSGRIVGSVEKNYNETLVYVPTDCKSVRLETANSNKQDIVFSSFGIENLSPKSTYELVITKIDSEKEEKMSSEEMVSVAEDWENKGIMDKSLYWMEKAAILNNVDAIGYLGEFYSDGKHGSSDYSKALYWFEKGAALNDPYCLFRSGLAYLESKGCAQDFNKAGNYFAQGMKDNGYSGVLCTYYYGVLISDAALSKQIFEYIEGLIDKQGFPNSVDVYYRLGRIYDKGLGVSVDKKKALEYYVKSAKQGFKNGFMAAALCSFNGEGVQKNYEAAVFNFRQCATADLKAEFDDPTMQAMSYLAMCYEHGLGVTQDLNMAKEWYRKAAELGDKWSESELKRFK